MTADPRRAWKSGATSLDGVPRCAWVDRRGRCRAPGTVRVTERGVPVFVLCRHHARSPRDVVLHTMEATAPKIFALTRMSRTGRDL